MKTIENDKKRYQEMKEKSISGEPAKRTGNKEYISRKDYVRKVKIIMATTSIATLLGLGAGKALVDTIKDRMTLNKLHKDFYEEVVKPETHVTDDHVHYYYDYGDMADKLEAMEDFDEGVYYLDNLIGDYQTGLVLKCTDDYDGFIHYKEVKGYKSTDEFKKDMQKQVLLKEEIRDKEKELEEMKQEHQANQDQMTADTGKGEK